MPLILFLSTGRCGTQYAASLLESAAPGARVTHEPLGERYAPRRTLRAPDLEACLAAMPEVRAHFEMIDRTVRDEGRLYVETGWPVFPWIPLLKRRYGAELVIVHLVREPVRFAFSMASHNLYAPQYRDDAFHELGALSPHDAGARFKGYAAHWDAFNEIEKCLYFWLEVHGWAEELKASLPGPWVTLRSRDLFDRPQAFLESLRAAHPALRDALRDPPTFPGVVDKWHYPVGFDVDRVRGPSEVAQLAARYGFDRPTPPEEIEQRFFA